MRIISYFNMSYLKRGRPLKRQAREIIYNVHKFMEKEAAEAKTKSMLMKDHFQNITERTALATGVSRKTVSNILKEYEKSQETPSTSGPTFRTPKKGRSKSFYRVKLDDFDYQAIRRKIYDFHITEKQLPTLKTLLIKLEQDINLKCSKDSLRRIIHDIGFRFKKVENNRKLLAEKDDIRLWRIKYLREIQKFRNEKRNIVYADETYVHATHTKDRAWTDASGKGLKKAISKGDRLIIVHAGNENGFVPGALLIYKASQSTGDYHKNMNKENFKKWLKEKLIPNLKPNSVLVVDNAAYHSTLIDKPPNSNSTKPQMQAWLDSKNIKYESFHLKPELYEIIKRHKKDHIKYSIDMIMEEHGHKVLRLPPYHPDFNPIENIWSQVKDYVSKRNIKMTLSEVNNLLEEKFSMIGPEEWSKVVKHAVECESEFLKYDHKIDGVLDELIISVNDSSDSDSSLFDIGSSDSELDIGVSPLDSS